MKIKLYFLVLFFVFSSKAIAFVEFYCDFTNGDNLNSGSTTNATATGTYTSKVVANGWDSTTGIFTVATGNPITNNIPLNEWASVYVTAGATVATYVARITATNATTITVSLAAKSGTAPATDATGATTIRIGGVWKGPNAAVSFPFGFVLNTMTNLNSGIIQGITPRINLKATATYAITALVTNAQVGPVIFQGMSAMGTPGDLGKATIDCATVGASISILSISGLNVDIADLIVSNSGATSGSSDGIINSGGEGTILRCVTHDIYRDGFQSSGVGNTFIECEAYLCNKSNTSARGGFNASGTPTYFIRCFSHDNVGNVNCGFVLAQASLALNCVADTCGASGFQCTSTSSAIVIGCDSYNNGFDGLNMPVSSGMCLVVQNSNFIKNAGWGINASTANVRNGLIINCGFGSGTQTNTLGDFVTGKTSGINIIGTVNYPSNLTPWVDPANGDFRINLSQAKAAGRGFFTETQSSYTNTISYPDIGAAQHRPAVLSYPFSN